ncbi:hypothetical protein Tco_1162784 [Tanacetum coccineum]
MGSNSVYWFAAKELFTWTPSFDSIKEHDYSSEDAIVQRSLKKLVEEILEIERWKIMELFQKAKVSWAIEGDENSKLIEDVFKGIQLQGSLALSHLFYADDAFFMGEWSDNNLRGSRVRGYGFFLLGCTIMWKQVKLSCQPCWRKQFPGLPWDKVLDFEDERAGLGRFGVISLLIERSS